MMMSKVSQNLPMMPNFGGECKTTGLKKIAAQLAQENQLKLPEFNRILPAVHVKKLLSTIPNFRHHVNQYLKTQLNQ